jgi:hypothetical protein
MLCDYHGYRVSQNSLSLFYTGGTDEGATFSTVGTFFLRLGFEVKYVGLLEGMPVKFLRLTGHDRYRAVINWCRRGVGENPGKPLLRSFMEEGGEFEPRFTTADDIAGSLKHGLPVVVSLEASVFWPTPIHSMYHAVVIYGMAHGHFLVNDPYRAHGGQRAWPIDTVMYAMWREEASALFIKPRPVTSP